MTSAPQWRTDGSAINDASMIFDSVTLTARTFAILVKISLELFEDAQTAATNTIEQAFDRSLAVELDWVALRVGGLM
jgi:HK97 family phage major capsid protein